MFRSTLAPAVLVLSLPALASQICSHSACIDGKASSSLLSYDLSASHYLLPGAYASHGNANIHPSLNITVSSSSSGLTVTAPPGAIAFDRPIYSGGSKRVEKNSEGWSSLYVPDGWYAVLEPGKAIWSSVPDGGQMPSGYGGRKIMKAASSACTQACTSHGTCRPSSNTTAMCHCEEGWTGATCDQCAPGHFGPSCSRNCTICDDGNTGTGECIGAPTSSTRMPLTVLLTGECNCAHGTCTPSGYCICSAGYSSNSTQTQCETCATGFYKDVSDNCLACPLGCTSCSLAPGSNEPSCTACSSGSSLLASHPSTCQAHGNCGPGSFWNAASSTCQSCSPACSTCTGPSSSECLACAPPRSNLNGTCVGIDASGVCDSSLSGLVGVYVINNGKQRCDSCPVGCATCSIPTFSPASSYTDVRCGRCQDGYLMQDGACVRVCGEGWYLPKESSALTCQRRSPCDGAETGCDGTCTECIGASTFCTRCSSGFASEGSCGSGCPTNAIFGNGTCDACHPECTTCSRPNSASHCSSCPPNRPILRDGRCLDYCTKTSYFDTSSGSCKDCDASCGSCGAAGDSSCTSCSDGSVLRSGKCEKTDCAFAPGLGVCLDAFLVKENKAKWAAMILLPLLAIGMGGWWYVRRERRKTREESRAFAEAMDSQEGRKESARLRLERVFGFERVQIPAVDPRGEELERKERKRLRELLLPSKRRRSVRDSIELASQDKEKGKQEKDDWRTSEWMVPPPPYMPSDSSSTSASGSGAMSTSTTGGHDPLARSPLPVGKVGVGEMESRTKIINLDSSSPVSPAPPVVVGLRPPPRPTVRAPLERQSSVIRGGEGSQALRELWPAMIQRDEVDLLSSDMDDGGMRREERGRWGHGYI